MSPLAAERTLPTMTRDPGPRARKRSAVGSLVGDALFFAGVVAAFIVLVPVYAVGAVLQRISSGVRAGLRFVLHRPRPATLQ